jgi:predicted ATPase
MPCATSVVDTEARALSCSDRAKSAITKICDHKSHEDRFSVVTAMRRWCCTAGDRLNERVCRPRKGAASSQSLGVSITICRLGKLLIVIGVSVRLRSFFAQRISTQRYQGMSGNPQRFFVITGGPGAGKSTLIAALAARGFARTIEAGRAIIQEEVASDGGALLWSDPGAFADRMFEWELRSYRCAEESDGIVFFDRGIPDVVGYLRLMNLPVPQQMVVAAHIRRYNASVFIAPPWPAIFAQDAERKQTLAEAVRTYQVMVETYARYGYQLIELPLVSVDERVAFVISRTRS